MAFVQILRTKAIRRSSVMARARIKNRTCVLSINGCGVDYLGSLAISLVKRDLADLFVDPETGNIGIRKSKEGQFELCPLGKVGLRISSMDLAKAIQADTDYTIEKHEEFHFVLVPIERQKGATNGNQTGNQQG